jgi:hypothetical protein
MGNGETKAHACDNCSRQFDKFRSVTVGISSRGTPQAEAERLYFNRPSWCFAGIAEQDDVGNGIKT